MCLSKRNTERENIMIHQTSELNELITSIVRKQLKDKEMTYVHLYREPRKTETQSNIGGKSIRFCGIRTRSISYERLQTVLSDIDSELAQHGYKTLLRSMGGQRYFNTIQVMRG
ncbi:hypothetical protein VPHD485_0296 [Vibrio phage D485]